MTTKLKKQELPPYFMSVVIAVLILGMIIGLASANSSSNALYPVAVIVLSPVLIGMSLAFLATAYAWCKLGVYIMQAVHLKHVSGKPFSLPGLLAMPYVIAAALSILSLLTFVAMVRNSDSLGAVAFLFVLWQLLVLLCYLSARRAHSFYRFLKSLSWMVNE